MATRRKPQESKGWVSKFVREFGWDVLLGSIAAFYVFMVPYTKVEESFNVQAMHDILYHRHHIEKYDHLDFPGVVPRTFIGALLVSILASPVVLVLHLLHAPKFYSLYAVRLVLGCITLSSLRSLRIEIRRKFGYHVEAFFVILTCVQFHLLFYSTRPLPNIFAFCLVTLAYSLWFRGDALSALKCLTIATAVFRCDIVLLFGTIGISLLLSKSVSLMEAIKCCIGTAFLCIGLTILVDTIMWGRVLWPELEVFWFNSVLNRSAEWGQQQSLPAGYITTGRKLFGGGFTSGCLSPFLSGCSIVTFMASYQNYPGGYALKALHQSVGTMNTTMDKWVHIDPFAAMNGVSRFLEKNPPWRYSKEEGITMAEYHTRNFTYLLSEHSKIDGFQCLFFVDGFSKAHLRIGFPPIVLLREPKVFVHGRIGHEDIALSNWPGCP